MAGVELGSAFIPIKADIDGLKRDLDGARDTISSKLGGAMKAAAGAMALGGVAIGGVLVGVGISATQAASDVNESLSKVGVVFGENAGKIEDWASRAASSMGQSRGEALAAAGTLGNLFVSMGLGSDDAAGLSTEMVGLAADLGSFNNIASSDALEKLRAGLVGEAEPLRAMGVNMNAAMVEAKALELGLADATGEVSEAGKVQARYAIIMEQTKTAQGDFARTSDGMANATKIIQATFADLQVQIGEQLLPIVAPLIASFAEWLPGAIETAKPILEDIGKVFADVTTTVGVVLTAIGDLATGWKTATVGVGTETSALWTTVEPLFSGIGKALAVFWEEIFPELEKTWTTVVANLKTATEGFATFWDENWGTIKTVLDTAISLITIAVDTWLGVLRGALTTVLALIRGDWQGAWDGIKTIFSSVGDGIVAVAGVWLGVLQGALSLAWDGIRGVAASAWQGIADAITGAFRSITQPIQNVISGIMRTIQPAIDAIKTITSFSPPDFGDVLGQINRITSVKIPGFAEGVTNFSGGLALVGERGPELLHLPGGSDVYPLADRLMAGMGGGGAAGGDVHVTLEVDGMAFARATATYTASENVRALANRISG